MNIKRFVLCLSIVLLFSMCTCQSQIPKENVNFDNMYKIIFDSNYDITQNGVKIQYYTLNSLEKEKDRLCSYFKLDPKKGQLGKNSYYFEGDFSSENLIVNITKNSSSNDEMFVQIEIIRKENILNVNGLMNKIRNIEDKNSKNIEYFTFSKGKLIKTCDKNNEMLRIKSLMRSNGATDFDTIPINSGFTTLAKFDEEFINYSICAYDDGIYLIVGTPILFTTY